MADILSMVNEADSPQTTFSELQSLLPEQFYGCRRGSAEGEPLRRLMTAMLIDALRCFETKVEPRQPARRQEFAEVRSWIFSDADDGVFSFNAVCEALEIDARALRRGLSRPQERNMKGEKRRIIRRPALLVKRISA